MKTLRAEASELTFILQVSMHSTGPTLVPKGPLLRRSSHAVWRELAPCTMGSESP